MKTRTLPPTAPLRLMPSLSVCCDFGGSQLPPRSPLAMSLTLPVITFLLSSLLSSSAQKFGVNASNFHSVLSLSTVCLQRRCDTWSRVELFLLPREMCLHFHCRLTLCSVSLHADACSIECCAPVNERKSMTVLCEEHIHMYFSDCSSLSTSSFSFLFPLCSFSLWSFLSSGLRAPSCSRLCVMSFAEGMQTQALLSALMLGWNLRVVSVLSAAFCSTEAFCLSFFLFHIFSPAT